MGIEIERKFLVTGTGWRQGAAVAMRQGYLCRDKDRTVRVRIAGYHAFLTVKGASARATRAQYEYGIPVSDALELLKICDGPLIEKKRFVVAYEGRAWEVDEFEGENAGLIVAELELGAEDDIFSRPPWLGPEVTHDHRYFNSRLASHPFRNWREL